MECMGVVIKGNGHHAKMVNAGFVSGRMRGAVSSTTSPECTVLW